MRRTVAFLAAAVAAFLFLLVPAASAADGAGAVDPVGIEAQLIMFAPIVAFLASIVLGPEAGEAVKKLIPAAITLIVSAVYFFAQSAPDVTGELIASIGLLGAVSNRVYEWLNAGSTLAFGRPMNQLTGPGLIGGRPAVGD